MNLESILGKREDVKAIVCGHNFYSKKHYGTMLECGPEHHVETWGFFCKKLVY